MSSCMNSIIHSQELLKRRLHMHQYFLTWSGAYLRRSFHGGWGTGERERKRSNIQLRRVISRHLEAVDMLESLILDLNLCRLNIWRKSTLYKSKLGEDNWVQIDLTCIFIYFKTINKVTKKGIGQLHWSPKPHAPPLPIKGHENPRRQERSRMRS